MQAKHFANILFISSSSRILKGWQGCDAKEGGVGMDGGGEAEYTRDPALLSPNDPHQSTSTVQQTATARKNTRRVNIDQEIVLIQEELQNREYC